MRSTPRDRYTEGQPFVRVIAVDWSGAVSAAQQRRSIWVAAAEGDALLHLEDGHTRDEVIEDLCARADSSGGVVVGFDFAFGFPKRFAESHGCRTLEDGWRLAKRDGETWLAECPPPFFGRRGTTRPSPDELFRETERRVGGSPKSVFQIAGPGAVGTASVRGMPYLLDLRDAGWHVWPLDVAGSATVVEIYPRVFTGPLVKGDFRARRDHLDRHFPGLPRRHREAMIASEDAFDAGVSALEIARHGVNPVALGQGGETERLEGAIWSGGHASGS